MVLVNICAKSMHLWWWSTGRIHFIWAGQRKRTWARSLKIINPGFARRMWKRAFQAEGTACVKLWRQGRETARGPHGHGVGCMEDSQQCVEQCFCGVVLREVSIRRPGYAVQTLLNEDRGWQWKREGQKYKPCNAHWIIRTWWEMVCVSGMGDQRGVWVVGLAQSDWLESSESLTSYYLQRRPARVEPPYTHPSPASRRRAEIKTVWLGNDIWG